MTSRDRSLSVVRYLGAAALLGVGIDHLQQYIGADYSVIPTIGTLFALNFAGSAAIALALVVPIGRAARHGRQIRGGLAALGIAVAAGSLAALFVSEHTPLFGFMEYGYRQAIVVSIVLEGVAIVLLSAYLVGTAGRPRGRPA